MYGGEQADWVTRVHATLLGYKGSHRTRKSEILLSLLSLPRTYLAPKEENQKDGNTPDGQEEETAQQQRRRRGQPARDEEETAEEDLLRTDIAEVAEDCPPTAHQIEQAKKREEARQHTQAMRALHFLQLGAPGKAIRTLEQVPTPTKGLASIADELERLHPAENVAEYPRPTSCAPPFNVTTRDVQKAVMRSLARGSAPGVDGWTGELIAPLLKIPNLLLELTEIVRVILPIFCERYRNASGNNNEIYIMQCNDMNNEI